MVQVKLTWKKSPDELGASIRAFGGKLNANVYRGMQQLEGEITAYAQANAPWQDQTGQARATLHATIAGAARTVTTLYLSHGMPYGKYLELCNGGRFGIISQTMIAFYPKAMQILRSAFADAG